MYVALMVLFSCLFANAAELPKASAKVKKPSMADILQSSTDSDWRELKPENTLYMDLPAGRVIIELAPNFAPRHVENIKILSQENYWDGLAVVRSQDNYVVQWADPNAENIQLKRKLKNAKETLPAEFDRNFDPKLSFFKLKDGDVYAREVGWVDGFQVARDPHSKKIWMIHCYGTVGAGRDNSIDSGGGTELYAVTGHSPRQLDRNVTLVGRVVQGIDLLSSLPRGTGSMGFYEKPEQNFKIKTIRLAADLPEKERTKMEVMRTDTNTFLRLIESRRNRPEEWFYRPARKIEICNVPIPTRAKVTK